MRLVEFVVVGLAAGWVMGKIRRGRGYGLIGNLLIGGIGSFIGWWMTGFLKVDAPNLLAEIAMAVIGAVVFFLAIDLVRFRWRKKSAKEGDE